MVLVRVVDHLDVYMCGVVLVSVVQYPKNIVVEGGCLDVPHRQAIDTFCVELSFLAQCHVGGVTVPKHLPPA